MVLSTIDIVIPLLWDEFMIPFVVMISFLSKYTTTREKNTLICLDQYQGQANFSWNVLKHWSALINLMALGELYVWDSVWFN